MTQLLFATFVWIVAVHSCAVVGAQRSNVLMCYNCSSSYSDGVDLGEVNCRDPFAMDGIVTVQCNGVCVKHIIESDVPSTIRNCHTLEEGACVNMDRYMYRPGVFFSQHCCHTNLCNGGCAMTFNLFALGAVVTVGLFVVKV